MATANLFRSAINGLFKKSTIIKAPVVCRLSTVALQQKYHVVKTAVKLYKTPINNGVIYRSTREYSTATKSKQELEDRVLKVCRGYDKLKECQLTPESHFLNDLGLDSLDHVEVIMAMEDEFGFEIPDGDAERLMRPRDIVQYISDKEDIYE